MAMYEYECKACGTNFDLLRSMSQDDSDVVCSSCGSPKVQRKLSLFASTVKDGGSSFSAADMGYGGSCSTGMCGCGDGTCSF
jgi:putative FmdB family regulatory protein